MVPSLVGLSPSNLCGHISHHSLLPPWPSLRPLTAATGPLCVLYPTWNTFHCPLETPVDHSALTFTSHCKEPNFYATQVPSLVGNHVTLHNITGHSYNCTFDHHLVSSCLSFCCKLHDKGSDFLFVYHVIPGAERSVWHMAGI